MNQDSSNNNGFSNRVRDFFWYCATSNKQVIEQCPTDHNKHTLIGTLVLLTAIFAFISGTFAMNYMFEGNPNGYYYALFFGLLWGFLIFSIDRLLISTIRKETGFELKQHSKVRQSFMVALRFLLAIVISVVITKPLELWLYEDQINAQIVDNVKGRNETDEQKLTDDFGIDYLAQSKQKTENSIKMYTDDIANVNNDSVYVNMTGKATSCQKDFDNLKWKTKKENEQKLADVNWIKGLNNNEYTEEGKIVQPNGGFMYGLILSDKGKRKIAQLEREVNDNKYRVSVKEKECARLKKAAANYKTALLDTLNKSLIAAQSDKIKTEKSLENNLETKSVVMDSLKRINKAADRGIFGRIDVLSQYNQSTWSRRLAGWLILMIFIMIETAPIIAKLVSKIGPYDYKLAALEYQAQQHEEQRKQLINMALKTQAEVAAKALEVWKNEQIQMVEDDPYAFVKEIEKRKKS